MTLLLNKMKWKMQMLYIGNIIFQMYNYFRWRGWRYFGRKVGKGSLREKGGRFLALRRLVVFDGFAHNFHFR